MYLNNWDVPTVCTLVVPYGNDRRDFDVLVKSFAQNFGDYFDFALWATNLELDNENIDDFRKFHEEVLRMTPTVVGNTVLYCDSICNVYKNFDTWMASEESARYYDNYLYLHDKLETKEDAKVIRWHSPPDGGSYILGWDAVKGTNRLGIGEGSFCYEDNGLRDQFNDDYDYEEDY